MMNDELLQILKKENSQPQMLYFIYTIYRSILHLQIWSLCCRCCTYKHVNNEENAPKGINIATSANQDGGIQKLQGGEFLLEETRNYVSETLENLEEKINGHGLHLHQK